MTDFYSQNRCVCSTRSHGPLLCAFCLSFHFNEFSWVSISSIVSAGLRRLRVSLYSGPPSLYCDTAATYVCAVPHRP